MSPVDKEGVEYLREDPTRASLWPSRRYLVGIDKRLEANSLIECVETSFQVCQQAFNVFSTSPTRGKSAGRELWEALSHQGKR